MSNDLPAGVQQLCQACCMRAHTMMLTDDLLRATLDGEPLSTALIDRLPPWRARMIVQVCLAAGARLQDGTNELFLEASKTAGIRDAGAAGWWRAALGVPAPPPEVPVRAATYHPPPGWTAVDETRA